MLQRKVKFPVWKFCICLGGCSFCVVESSPVVTGFMAIGNLCGWGLFNDARAEKEIMATRDPKVMKTVGRSVENFVQSKWNETSYNVMMECNYAKVGAWVSPAGCREMRVAVLAKPEPAPGAVRHRGHDAGGVEPERLDLGHRPGDGRPARLAPGQLARPQPARRRADAHPRRHARPGALRRRAEHGARRPQPVRHLVTRCHAPKGPCVVCSVGLLFRATQSVYVAFPLDFMRSNLRYLLSSFYPRFSISSLWKLPFQICTNFVFEFYSYTIVFWKFHIIISHKGVCLPCLTTSFSYNMLSLNLLCCFYIDF